MFALLTRNPLSFVILALSLVPGQVAVAYDVPTALMLIISIVGGVIGGRIAIGYAVRRDARLLMVRIRAEANRQGSTPEELGLPSSIDEILQ